eukprot:scaffold142425_cov12-Tisochrysis_lutea.AAC.1
MLRGGAALFCVVIGTMPALLSDLIAITTAATAAAAAPHAAAGPAVHAVADCSCPGGVRLHRPPAEQH